MALKSNIRNAVVRCIPPFFYPALRELMSSSFVQQLMKRIGMSPYETAWNTIALGPYKGIELYIDAANGTWAKEMVLGIYDVYFSSFLKKLKTQNKTFFDIGAHIGYSTLSFATHVGKQGKVIAFEPNPHNFERLRMNVERNTVFAPQIRQFPFALSNKDGKESFVFSNIIEDGTSSGSFLASAHTILDKASYEKEFRFHRTSVRTMKIDSFVKKYRITPDFMKIDVEGAEIYVLQGAQQVLKKYKPTLFIELHSIFNAFTVTEMLKDDGYAMKLLHEEQDGRCFIVALPQK